MLYGANGNVRQGRMPIIQQRAELWARWVVANPDKAAAMAETNGCRPQDLPRGCGPTAC